MTYDQGNSDTLRDRFWTALGASPFVMLQTAADPHSAAPMTVQLDPAASHAIWFITTRDSRFAAGGPAIATFTSTGHDLFARFDGHLVEETGAARLDREWSPTVAAWYPGGRDDPNLLFLRMDLGEAAIWTGATEPSGPAGTRGQFAATRL